MPPLKQNVPAEPKEAKEYTYTYRQGTKDGKWCTYTYRHYGRGPWGWPGGRPPRHWFFMRILFIFFWICAALAAVSLFSGGNFSTQHIPHYLGWTLLIMCAGFLLLGRMFRPLRMLMKGVQEISNGNLDFQFQAHGRHGEIDYLSQHFNLMVQRVREMVESKDQLLLDVSHELRSPLTRLKLALEMTPKSKMRASMLQDIAEMEKMLAEILETQRLRGENGKLTLATVDLAALTREMIQKYKFREPGVKLTGKPGPLVVTVDEARVKTVLQNVLENALKYSAGRKKPVEVSLSPGEGGVTLTIQDFGEGIPLGEQERVFEPFYRVDKSRTKETGGYGLGLSLCREIMRAHGGDITLESEPRHGTRMILWFPIER